MNTSSMTRHRLEVDLFFLRGDLITCFRSFLNLLYSRDLLNAGFVSSSTLSIAFYRPRSKEQ
jgi:hypothetical protein